MMRFNRITAMLIALLIIVSAAFSAVSAAGAPTESDGVRISEKMQAKSYMAATGTELNYRIYFSPGYDRRDYEKPATLIIYFHNESGKGNDNTTHLAERGLLNQLVSDSADGMFADYQYIVVAPQCPEGKDFTDREIISAVGELREELFATETLISKCIVMGVGTGVNGAVEFGSRYTDHVSRLVAVGGSPDKKVAFGVLTTGVTMMYFAEASNTYAKDFYDYAEDLGEGGYLDMTFTEGNLSASINAALTQSDPSVTEWAVKDAYESRYFKINVHCTDGAGMISASPDSVRYGGNCSVIITVNKGYVVDRLVVNGNDKPLSELEQSANNKNQYILNLMGVTDEQSVVAELVRVPTSGEKEGLIDSLITYLTVASAVLLAAALAVSALSALKKKKD